MATYILFTVHTHTPTTTPTTMTTTTSLIFYSIDKYFMRRAKSFMATVIKTALGIEHYWGRVEFVPGRGAIYLHIVAIANDMAYFQDFFMQKLQKTRQL